MELSKEELAAISNVLGLACNYYGNDAQTYTGLSLVELEILRERILKEHDSK